MKRRQDTLPKPNTREEIVSLADGMIRRRGFNAFSYGDLSVIMDVRPAAIHYHFRNKTGLGQEVVQQELFRLRAYRRLNAQVSGEEQLKHLSMTFYRNSQWQNVCLMGSLLPDYATLEVSMQQVVADLSNEIQEWVSWCLEDARKKGRLHFEGTAADRALLLLSVLLSSLLLVRVQGGEVFVQMVDRFLADLGANWRVADLKLQEDNELWPEEPHSFT